MVAKKGRKKPEKPYPKFPLYAHSNGQWVKKIGGKQKSFGVWDDPYGAEKAYKEWLLNPYQKAAVEGYALHDLINKFLADNKQRVANKMLAQRTWNEYKDAGERLVASLGRNRPLDSLDPDAFDIVLKDFPDTWGGTRRDNEIARMRTILNYVVPGKANMLKYPIPYGPNFRKRNNREMKKVRVEAPNRVFTGEQLRLCLDHAKGPMEAMIWLGVNTGIGNNDLGQMHPSEIDLVSGWMTNFRRKTGEPRRAKLWPETITAVRKHRSESSRYMFLTKYKNPWADPAMPGTAIGQEFTKIMNAAKVNRKGLSFYSLRHTVQTLADGCKDPVAVMRVMGHKDGSMSATYRGHIEDDRLEAVSDYLRDNLKELFVLDEDK